MTPDQRHEELEKTMAAHIAHDEAVQDGLTEDIVEIKGHIKIIRENHLAHVQASLATVETDMGWVKKYLTYASWVLGLIIAGLIVAVLKP